MRKIVRPPAPDFLTEKLQKNLGNKYRKKREEKGTSYEFKWSTIKGEKLNQRLLPFLRAISITHCFYCDAYPIKSYGERIDHFKPKSNALYYEDVCRWENLYLCCEHCNSHKKEHFDEQLLRPDDLNYNFDDYFEYIPTTGKIEVKTDISTENQQRGEVTRRILGFNDGDKPDDRKRFWGFWHNDPENKENLNIYNFRFIFDKLITLQQTI